jgi:hypothetical protein
MNADDMNTDDKKPEWFQLTEGDRAPAKPRITRGVRLFALTVPLLLLGTGFLVAQNQNGSGAAAKTQPLAQAASASSAPAVAPTTTSVQSAQNSTTVPLAQNQAILSATRSVSFISPLIKPPTGGGEEGDDSAGIGIAPAIGTVPANGSVPAIGIPPSIKAPTGESEGSDN